MRLLYIAVNDRTPLYAEQYSDSFKSSAMNSGPTNAYLVDNSDGDLAGVLESNLKQSGSPVTCITPHANLGYFGAARLAFDMAIKAVGWPDWTIVSNVDLRFDPDEFARELEGLAKDGVGVVAPRIVSSRSGRDLNPMMKRRPSWARMHFYKWLFRSYILASAYELASECRIRIKRRLTAAGVRSTSSMNTNCRPERIYAPHGSLMIFSKLYFELGGTLQHTPFLFGEEITIAERARALGLKVIYCPRIVVEHLEHASVALLPSRRVHMYVAEAAAYCADNYFGARCRGLL